MRKSTGSSDNRGFKKIKFESQQQEGKKGSTKEERIEETVAALMKDGVDVKDALLIDASGSMVGILVQEGLEMVSTIVTEIAALLSRYVTKQAVSNGMKRSMEMDPETVTRFVSSNGTECVLRLVVNQGDPCCINSISWFLSATHIASCDCGCTGEAQR